MFYILFPLTSLLWVWAAVFTSSLRCHFFKTRISYNFRLSKKFFEVVWYFLGGSLCLSVFFLCCSGARILGNCLPPSKNTNGTMKNVDKNVWQLKETLHMIFQHFGSSLLRNIWQYTCMWMKNHVKEIVPAGIVIFTNLDSKSCAWDPWLIKCA